MGKRTTVVSLTRQRLVRSLIVDSESDCLEGFSHVASLKAVETKVKGNDRIGKSLSGPSSERDRSKRTAPGSETESLLSSPTPLCLPTIFGRRGVLSYPSNVAGRPSLWRLIMTNHLGEEIDIVVTFTSHLLANGMKFFKKVWTLVHRAIR